MVCLAAVGLAHVGLAAACWWWRLLVNAVVRQADATMSLLFAACTSASLASKQSAAPQAREATIKKAHRRA